MFCANCGSAIKEGILFCGSCGSKIKAQTEDQTEAQVRPQPGSLAQSQNTQKASSSKTVPVISILLIVLIGAAGAVGGIFFGQMFLGPEDPPAQTALNEASAAPAISDMPDAPSDAQASDAPAATDPEASVAPAFDSIYVRRVTEEFMGLYRSLFMSYDAFIIDLLGENIWDRDDTIDILASPLNSRMITAPYLRSHAFDSASATIGSLMSATGFSLYDFNYDGMPEIVIYFAPMFANGPGNPAELFVYTNGQYRLAGVLKSPWFLTDNRGRLIVIETDSDWSVSASYLNISGDGISLDFIHRWDGFDDYIDFHSPTIPNVDGILSHVSRLTSLEDSIKDSLTQKFRTMPPAAAAPVAPAPAMVSDGFILPFSGSRYLTESDLLGLNAEELRLARNEIYARHGRRFRDEGLQAYFDSMPWYTPTLPLGEEPVLSDMERTNVELIRSFEGRF